MHLPINGTEVRSLMPQHWNLPGRFGSGRDGSQTQVETPFTTTGVVHGFLLQSFAVAPAHGVIADSQGQQSSAGI